MPPRLGPTIRSHRGNVNGSPASYGGTLAGISSVQQMAEAPAAAEVAIIPGTADTTIQINETNFLASVKQIAIPAFPAPDGGSVTAHGKFVFATSDLDMLYVIEQADPSSGALHDYAIASFRP